MYLSPLLRAFVGKLLSRNFCTLRWRRPKDCSLASICIGLGDRSSVRAGDVVVGCFIGVGRRRDRVCFDEGLLATVFGIEVIAGGRLVVFSGGPR